MAPSSNSNQSSSNPSPPTPLSTYALLFTGLIKYHQSRISVTSQLERKLGDMGERVGRRVWESVSYRRGAGSSVSSLQVSSGGNSGALSQMTSSSMLGSHQDYSSGNRSSVTAALTSSMLGGITSSAGGSNNNNNTVYASSSTPSHYPSIALNTSKLQRELKIEGVLKVLQTQIWPHLYGKKALDVKKAEDPPNSYLFYDEFPLEERHVSLPREISSLRTSAFTAGIIEGCLRAANFETVVRAHKPEGKNFFVFIVTLKEEALRREEMWK
mmetsp:Transcript_9519/g.35302  ORF Transcript_9519/g.35302 Transcript_9519/m.35302 type:complete len:270 (-) Transcript_9519:367-1176(-)|eukprot:CAMPEP_0117436428 /NCGR_PEP_ID=MMETSP0759-20121206/1002_1 /TAXON_ID=63605 /ORGANISM="Percolomonas cosmopolitus, Strain WS" /LENGTH=269 /DNA_ID=CAMNT_0005228027 /DNA_START=1351 /DNA_END=2160 /DNA_ORIENTATION=+